MRLQPLVSPMYSATAQLPADAQRSAMVRGVQWYERSGLLANPSMLAYVAHYWDDVCGGKQCSLPAPPQSQCRVNVISVALRDSSGAH